MTSAAGIVVHCDAGPKAGYGHLSRCLILSRALQEYGVRIKILVGGGGQNAVDFARRQGFDIDLTAQDIGTDENAARVIDACQSFDCASVILDSRELHPGYLRRLGAVFVTILDDDGRQDLSCNILVNPHFWASPDNYKTSQARHILAGADCNLVHPAYFEQRAGRSCNHPIRRILITMGGEDPWNATSWLIRNAADILANIFVDIVVGAAHPQAVDVDAAAQLLPRARVIRAPAGLMEYTAIADLAISAGGTTCYELAAAGVAIAAVSLEPHQDILIGRLVERGAAICIARCAEKDVAQMRSRLQSLLTDTLMRERLNDDARSLFAAPGADHVAAAIQNLTNL